MDEATDLEVVSVGDLGRGPLPDGPVVLVDLDRRAHRWEVAAALQRITATPGPLTVGVTRQVVAPGLDQLAEALTCTVGDGAPSSSTALVPDLVDTVRTISAAVARAPHAAAELDALLRTTERAGLRDGLEAESATLARLRSGAEFARLRANQPVRSSASDEGPAVVVGKDGGRLVVELNRPHSHNAFTRAVRDGLVNALDLVPADRSITQIVLRGRGDGFCGGGDPEEPDPHPGQDTLQRSVGVRLDRLRARTTVEVHGRCVGPGAALPAFAGRVVARRDSWFQLPELAWGLVPPAGGTVSITRRIGRPRTAFLALTGARIDAATALGWGLVDLLA